MERFVQLLDDVDDLLGSSWLIVERIRAIAYGLALVSISLSVQVAGILLALRQPPLALAAALLMFVGLLYHRVTAPRPTPPLASRAST